MSAVHSICHGSQSSLAASFPELWDPVLFTPRVLILLLDTILPLSCCDSRSHLPPELGSVRCLLQVLSSGPEDKVLGTSG